MKKILITGFTGMLGRSIVTTLAKNESFQLYGIARNGEETLNNIQQVLGDLTDQSFIQSLRNLKPDIIIHTSALVDLNLCETDKALANEINIISGASLAKLFPDAYYLYISTDSVFDGIKGGYKEEATTNPLNYYAYTKLKGEAAIQEISKHALILRTNIYGHKVNGQSLFDWAYQSLKENKSIQGFQDVYFNPLYTGQVAEIIENILTKHPKILGVLHLGTQEGLNKYEFLKLIAKVFQLEETLITPTSIKDVKLKVERPLNTTLNISKLNTIVREQYFIEKGLEALKQNLRATNIELIKL